GFEYSLDGGAFQASATFTGVLPGGHNITVRNTAEPTCVSAPTAVTVNAVPTPPVAPTASVTVQPTCAVPTATIVVSAPTGAAFEYSLDGGAFQASATFTGVLPGGHNVTVINTADPTCVSAPTPVTENAVPTPPVAPTAAVTVQPSCAVPTGTIVVSAPTGVGFEYSIDGGAFQASATFTNVAPGNHNITVINTADPTCISAPTQVTVNTVPGAPVAPTASVTVQPTCAVPTGTIVVSAPTGVNFQYSLDGGAFQASATFTGVNPGGHNVTVINPADPACISAPATVTVNVVPTPPVAPTASVTVQPTCAVPTGTIEVSAPTGVVFEYSIDGGAFQASATFTGVLPGGHNITVRNTAEPSCVSAPTAVTVNAVPTPPVAPTASVTVQPTCAVPTATIVVSAPTGVAFEYSLDGGAFQASATFTGVLPGGHNVTVINTADPTCVSAPTPVTVNAVPTPPVAPTAAVTVQPSCAVPTGTVEVTLPLGAAFEYSIDGGVFQASATFTNVAPGNHNITVINTADPTCISAPTPVTVNTVPGAPVAPTASVTVQPTCAVPTGTIEVSAPLGVNFQYSLDGGAFQASATFTGVNPGTHNITLINTVDPTCISAPATVTVNAVPTPPVAPTAAVTVQPTCAVPNGTIEVSAPTGVGF